GVIPVDRRPASELLDDIARLELPEDRLTLGVGAGQTRRGALAMVERNLVELRAATSAALALGALGPKMRALAADAADAVVLSGLRPEAAADQAAACRARNPQGSAVLYARPNQDPAARERLEEEAGRYAGFPAYAAHFDRLGFSARDTVLPREANAPIEPRLAQYLEAVDEVVLRAITPADRVDEYLAFLPLASCRANGAGAAPQHPPRGPRHARIRRGGPSPRTVLSISRGSLPVRLSAGPAGC